MGMQKDKWNKRVDKGQLNHEAGIAKQILRQPPHQASLVVLYCDDNHVLVNILLAHELLVLVADSQGLGREQVPLNPILVVTLLLHLPDEPGAAVAVVAVLLQRRHHNHQK